MTNALEELQMENDRLRRQVFEMESFLSDYGLVWVGTNGDDGEYEEKGKKEEGKQEKLTDDFEFNVDKFLSRVKVSA